MNPNPSINANQQLVLPHIQPLEQPPVLRQRCVQFNHQQLRETTGVRDDNIGVSDNNTGVGRNQNDETAAQPIQVNEPGQAVPNVDEDIAEYLTCITESERITEDEQVGRKKNCI